MKQKVTFFSFLFLASSVFASTNVSNNLTGDNQWNADGNPYVIQGKTVLAKGATLRIGPNVKMVFQGNAALEVDGTLDVTGSAAAPAVFDMTQGGLQSELFLNGADADISNAKFLSGVFLVQDSQLHLQWFEITKGSGLYLRGTGTASVKNGKIYGNATGVVLEGKVNATLRFNTITQNSYGLYLKGFSDLQFKNNSIHDNDKDVINNTPALNLGGNYWGTTDEKTASTKMQGQVSLGPMVSLKDLLRVYIQTQLPEITKEMSVALAKKEKKEALELAKKQKAAGATTATAQVPLGRASSTSSGQAGTPETAKAPSTVEEIPPAPAAVENTPETAPQPAPETAAAPAPETPAAPAPVEETGAVKTIQVKSLPAAPHQLKSLANLPPDQGNVAESPASVPPATASAAPSSATNETTSPAPPSAPDLNLPPSTTASETTPPVPPEVSGSTSSPATGSNTTTTAAPEAPPVPPASDVIAPPDITTSTTSPSTGNNSSSTSQSVPAPPDLNEQLPPTPPQEVTTPSTSSSPASQTTAATTVTAPPPPPVVAPANADQSLTPVPADSPALQLNPNPTADQKNAVNSLNGVSGDIDGMQAPPLDIDSSKSSNSAAQTQNSNNSGVVLPPIPDSDVAPPKDLDLPPTDDLGNINLDSKNK